MRKLILTSSGLSPEIGKELLSLLGEKPAEIKVGFISNAADQIEDKAFILKDKGDLTAVGFEEIIDIDLRIKEDMEKISECGVLFVEGGNTYYLLKLIRESGFDKLLKEFLSDDKMYIGVSAGSVVLGTNIETAGVGPSADPNDVKIEDTRGLRQAPFMIAPHMNQKEKFYFDQFARKMALRPIVGIEDGQAIVCEGDRYHVIGPGRPLTWNSKLFR